MGTDLLGFGQNASNVQFTRPPDARVFGNADTYARDCSTPTAGDGTAILAGWGVGLMQQLRALIRGNGQTAALNNIITEDNTNDAMALQSIQQLIQRGQMRFGIDTGVAGALVVAMTPALVEYKKGASIKVLALNDCPGPSTISVNGLGARNITRKKGLPLQPGDFLGGGVMTLDDDGLQFQLADIAPFYSNAAQIVTASAVLNLTLQQRSIALQRTVAPAAMTINLPVAAENGHEVIIDDVFGNLQPFPATVTAPAGETIGVAASYTMDVNFRQSIFRLYAESHNPDLELFDAMTFSSFVLPRHARALAVTFTLALAALCYALVPPPPPAAAFGEQGTWGGTATGSANALTIAVANVHTLNDLLGVPIRFKPGVDNAPGPVNVAVGGQALTPLKRPTSIGLQDLGSELQAGVTSEIMFTGSVFEIISAIDMTPIGNAVEIRGGVVTRGSMIEDGSCVSQTQYAALFSRIGTTYGGGCSAGFFPVPDSRGTVFAALDGQGVNGSANRITTTSCGTPNSVGAHCGGDKFTISTAFLPASPLSVSGPALSVTGPALNVSGATSGYAPTVGGVAASAVPNGTTPIAFSAAGGNATFQSNNFSTLQGFSSLAVSGATSPVTGTTAAVSGTTANMGSGSPFPVLDPTVLGLRAIKY